MFVVFWSIVIVVVLGILTGIISGKGIDWNEVRDKIVEGGGASGLSCSFDTGSNRHCGSRH